VIPAAAVARRDQVVLVVIDIQERLAATMQHRDRVIDRSSLLVRACDLVGAPIHVTRQYPAGLGPCSPPIEQVIAEARDRGTAVAEHDKMTFDCFADEAFTAAVCAHGRTQLVLCGMESHICVTQTALSGLREGFDVHVAVDACCSQRDEDHAAALTRLAQAGAVISTAESVAYELVGVAGTPEFKQLLRAVKGTPLAPAE
jgi:nicotinamidase-related amidase